jgi:hypothetical protein
MNQALSRYLLDHLAGAQAALSLIDRLTDLEPTRRDWMLRLRVEVDADRVTIARVIARLQIDESHQTPVLPWTLDLDPSPRDPLLLLTDTLEALTLRTLGKHKLWVTLTAIARHYPALHDVNLDRLRARAVEQHAAIEHERLAIALVAFRNPAHSRLADSGASGTNSD